MDQSTVMLGRFLAVAYGAAFSGVLIHLVLADTLSFYLNDDKFTLLVLLGGVLLAAIVLLKARTLIAPESGHSHDHHDHDHDHHHGEGDHADHGHTHGEVSLWRYIVLTFPLLLVFTGLTPKQFTVTGIQNRMTSEQLAALESMRSTAVPERIDLDADFKTTDLKELHDARDKPAQREKWATEKAPVQVVGQFIPDQRFGDRYNLTIMKIECCAADGRPITLPVMKAGDYQAQLKPGEWIRSVGWISFVEVPTRDGQKDFYTVFHEIQPPAGTEPQTTY